MQQIIGVEAKSIAQNAGILAGDKLVSINGEQVADIVDYEYLCAEENLTLNLIRQNSQAYEVKVKKDAYESLGLRFKTELMSRVRTCNNRCIFCFVDQMPKGCRKSLSFKDDDWRMSFYMGNYITLTNISDTEFKRILKRRISPLYISVHATDSEVRKKIMGNADAGKLMYMLTQLRKANLQFHSQIVCCPGINDGEVLHKTLSDLFSLFPSAASVAVVPVGLTKYREGLFPLRIFTTGEAKALLALVNSFAATCKKVADTSFVYAADELILLAGAALPEYDEYEDFAQLENGVGLLRQFERGFIDAISKMNPLDIHFSFDAAGGTLAHLFMKELLLAFEPYKIHPTLHAIENIYFGSSVTVGGLITGKDLISQLKGKLSSNILFLPHSMLKAQEDVFLDGMTVQALSNELEAAVIPVRGEGDKWVETVFAEAMRRHTQHKEVVF